MTMVVIPKLLKTEWPVRITDALGIPSIRGKAGPWHSTEGTTDAAWFHAMCDFLGIAYPGERIRAMKAIIEAAGGTWNQSRHSSAVPGKQAGGNVRKEAFEELWDALHRSGFLSSTDEPALAADALHEDTGAGPLPEPRWTYQHIRLRQGQPAFRARLLVVYGGRCAVTGTDISETLEAAHIRPHAKGGTMDVTNGVLLRADVHTLFDLRLVAVDTTNWTLLVHPDVLETASAKALDGSPIRLPADPQHWPSSLALDEHRQSSGL